MGKKGEDRLMTIIKDGLKYLLINGVLIPVLDKDGNHEKVTH
jgi:hypothetical protein